MDLLTLSLLVTVLVLPLRWMVRMELEWWESPEYFRRYGVIVRRDEALDARSEVIGHYADVPIHRAVTFKGLEYEFAGIVPPRYQTRIDENELYLEPGLLYLLRRAGASAGAAPALIP